MTKDQVLAAIRKYDAWLVNHGDIPARRFDTAAQRPKFFDALSHVRWMLAELEKLADVPGKADRWIGFVQGVLWLAGFASIDEFKEDNR